MLTVYNRSSHNSGCCSSRNSSSSSSPALRASSSRSRPRTSTAAFKLRPSSGGDVISVDQACFLIGSGAAADLKLQGDQVAAEHAELQQKGKQVFLKALQGESVFDRTFTWIDDAEARANVSYVLASNSTLAFGDQQQAFTIEFDEPSGSNPLVEMLMKGMASSASSDVQKELLG